MTRRSTRHASSFTWVELALVVTLLAAAFLFVTHRGPWVIGPASSGPVPSMIVLTTHAPSGGTSPSGDTSPAAVRLFGEPIYALTPGLADPAVTQANIQQTICVSGYTAKVRPPSSYTTKLKISQFDAYGYSDRKTGDYEEDHLISLTIGGSPTDPRNLWPEPYTLLDAHGLDWGARTKDKVENWLNDQVCAGTMTLAAAQQAEATDWPTIFTTAGLKHAVPSDSKEP